MDRTPCCTTAGLGRPARPRRGKHGPGRRRNAAAPAAAFAAALLFVATYQRLAPWGASQAGRHVMADIAAIGLLGLYAAPTTVWPAAAPVLRVVRIVLALAIAGLIAQRTWMVIRAQRQPGPAPEWPDTRSATRAGVSLSS